MLKKRDLLDYINQKLAPLQAYIENKGAMGLYDSHIIAEDFATGLLNIIFDYQLENLNFTVQKNQFTIDLADSVNGVSFQVTSRKDRRKIADTIDDFVINGLYEKYPNLFFLILGKKRNYRPFSGHEGYFDFDNKKHILDFQDILKQIRGLNLKKLEAIKEFLNAEIKPDTSSEAQTELTLQEIKELVRSAREKKDKPNFRRKKLVEADLYRVDLAGADFTKADLRRADLTFANLEGAILSGAKLHKATLYRTHLKGANLQLAELDEAILSYPTLTDADLSEVDLSKAKKVDLDDAHMENVKLFATNLEGVNLNKAILTGAEYSKNTTKWPENFDPKKAGAIPR